jgi:flagellar biosynthesis GTPase FlhF
LFSYEEYISLCGVDDPDEGYLHIYISYETINDLLNLLSKLDLFQKQIFGNFRASTNNEARISALVPLVEESFGIYQFILSMMTAMHQIIGSVQVLGPLREAFNRGHYSLRKFYEDCSNLKFLTTLVSVPKLCQDAPNFLSQGQPTKQPKVHASNRDLDRQKEREREEERARELERLQREEDIARQREFELHNQQEQQHQQQQQQLHNQQEQQRFQQQQQLQQREGPKCS